MCIKKNFPGFAGPPYLGGGYYVTVGINWDNVGGSGGGAPGKILGKSSVVLEGERCFFLLQNVSKIPDNHVTFQKMRVSWGG